VVTYTLELLIWYAPVACLTENDMLLSVKWSWNNGGIGAHSKCIGTNYRTNCYGIAVSFIPMKARSFSRNFHWMKLMKKISYFITFWKMHLKSSLFTQPFAWLSHLLQIMANWLVYLFWYAFRNRTILVRIFYKLLVVNIISSWLNKFPKSVSLHVYLEMPVVQIAG
jgi:hypothetical protein